MGAAFYAMRLSLPAPTYIPAIAGILGVTLGYTYAPVVYSFIISLVK